MFKGVWWLIAVWGGFIVLVAAHRSEAFSVNQESVNVRMIDSVLNVGSCTINRFWKSLGIEKVSYEAPICSSADLRLA